MPRAFADNQVRLQLFALAFNLGNFLRRLALPRSVQHRTLTTLRNGLIKIGVKVVPHARRVTFQMAEVAVPRSRFTAILQRIGRLRVSPNPAGGRARDERHPLPEPGADTGGIGGTLPVRSRLVQHGAIMRTNVDHAVR